MGSRREVFSAGRSSLNLLSPYRTSRGCGQKLTTVGIPGTFGGALAMNAGSYGEETWRYVIAVETMNRHGEQFLRHPNEFHVGYREVIIPQDEWFIAGHLCFLSENNLLPREKICEVLKKRILSQPIGTLNCGSVFRNPPGKYAAELIEASQFGRLVMLSAGAWSVPEFFYSTFWVSSNKKTWNSVESHQSSGLAG